MTGTITGREEFIIASFAISAIVIGALVFWSWYKLNQAKKRLKMLEQTSEQPADETQTI